MTYGRTNSSATDIFRDELSFHASLLNDVGLSWRNQIESEIQRCEQFADALGDLARNLAIAAGVSIKSKELLAGASQKAKEQFYFRIDQPFRQWLYSIDPDGTEDKLNDSLDLWRKQSKKIAYALRNQLIEAAGPSAFVGRLIKKKRRNKETEFRYATPIASNIFAGQIKMIEENGGL